MPSPVTPVFAFLGLPGGMEWVVLLVIGLLLFGARLPSVGRNIGKSITEFKKGMKEATDGAMNEVNADVDVRPAAPKQISHEQVMEQATQEALRRMKAEQAAGATGGAGQAGQSGGKA